MLRHIHAKTEVIKFGHWYRFGEQVSNVIGRGNVAEFDLVGLDSVAKKVMSHVDVFRPVVVNGIL